MERRKNAPPQRLKIAGRPIFLDGGRFWLSFPFSGSSTFQGEVFFFSFPVGRRGGPTWLKGWFLKFPIGELRTSLIGMNSPPAPFYP